MTERTITDRAGDIWTLTPARAQREEGAERVRCLHELGYELLITVRGAVAELDDGAILEALERARRAVPATEMAEAA